MRLRPLLGSAGWALGFLVLTAVFQGEDRRLSLEIWLAACSVWFFSLLLARMLRVSPVHFGSLNPLWSPERDRRAASGADQPQELRSATALLLRARDNPRVLANQLRPRLVALADHSLLINHGIDRSRDPEQARAALGELAWLLDDNERERAPTLDEIADLLTLLDRQPDTSLPIIQGPS